MLIELLSNTGFIMYNKAVSRLLGTNESILLGELCSKYQYWMSEGSLASNDGWFYITQREIQDDTGLTPYQQRNAIQTLKDAGIIFTALRGNPATTHFQVSEIMLHNLLSRNFISSYEETAQQDVKKLDNYIIRNNKKENKKEKKIYISPAMGEFENVYLTADEKDRLVQRLGKDRTEGYIERLSGWLAEGHTKKNHYATILNWWRKDGGQAVQPDAPAEVVTVPTKPRTAEDIKKLSVEELLSSGS